MFPLSTQIPKNAVAGDGAEGLLVKWTVFFLLSFEALDMKTSVKAVKKILSNASNEMIEALFLKVDMNCNGLTSAASGGWRVQSLAGQWGTWRAEEGGRLWGACWIEGTLGVFEGALPRPL